MNSDAGFTKDQLQTGLEEINGDLPEADFWTTSSESPRKRANVTSGLPVIREESAQAAASLCVIAFPAFRRQLHLQRKLSTI